jgi:ABC-type nitrate/sulfonate/bicarbonate transport system substrate-binding protein
VVVASGCGGSDDAAADNSVRVGYAFGNDAGDTPDMLAYENLRKEGTKVDISSTGALENSVAALRRGSIDIAVLTQPSLIQAISQGAPLEAIVAQNMTSESEIVTRGDATFSDLAGTRVAVGHGLAGTALVALASEAAGLPKGAVGVRTVPESGARAVGLRLGRLKVSELDSSDAIRLQGELPDLHVLARLADYAPLTAQLAFVVRPGFATKHSELVQTFVSAVLAASQTLYGPDGRATFIRVALANALKGDSAELAGKIYDYYREVGMWPKASRPITAEQYRKVSAFFRSSGQIESPEPFERVWDTTFWRHG